MKLELSEFKYDTATLDISFAAPPPPQSNNFYFEVSKLLKNLNEKQSKYQSTFLGT
jgi:hypothetical protein